MKIFSHRKLPINFSPKDTALFSHELLKEFDLPQIFELKNQIFDRDLTLFSAKKKSNPKLLEKTNWYFFKYQIQFFAFILKKGLKPIFSPVLLFTDTWSGGYFHWILDALPRLYLALKDYKLQKIYLPESFKHFAYIEPSLQTFGLKEIVFLNAKQLYWSPKLLFPTHLAPTGNYNDEILMEMKNKICKALNLNNIEPNQRIYISRSKSERRKVVNDDEVQTLLAKYDFQTVYTEHLAWREQVELLYQTRYLISNHGAGLTNILFMQAGTSVLELRKENDTHNNCYFSLASAVRVKYYYQVCKAENPDEEAHTANIWVNIESLEKVLKNFAKV